MHFSTLILFLLRTILGRGTQWPIERTLTCVVLRYSQSHLKSYRISNYYSGSKNKAIASTITIINHNRFRPCVKLPRTPHNDQITRQNQVHSLIACFRNIYVSCRSRKMLLRTYLDGACLVSSNAERVFCSACICCNSRRLWVSALISSWAAKYRFDSYSPPSQSFKGGSGGRHPTR